MSSLNGPILLGGLLVRPLGDQGAWIVRPPAGAREEAYAEQLRRQPGITAAEPDRLHPIQGAPNDPLYPQQWHLARVRAAEAWDRSLGSPRVLVAILDTGIDPDHPELASKVVGGTNLVGGNSSWADDHGHGTAVAGVVAAATNNSLGVASLGAGCGMLAVKVADARGVASTSNLYQGLLWAADRGAKVANLSFRVSESSFVALGMQYFVSKGGVVTVSAGNQGDQSTAPDNPHCLTVSATTSADSVATWSTTGSIVDLAAPGDLILTTQRGGTYGYWSGTSFSAPLVAAAAALAFARNGGLEPSAVVNALRLGAKDLGASGWDPSFGYGRLDAAAALDLLPGGEPDDTTPPSVEFVEPTSGASLRGVVQVAVRASDDRRVRSIRWLLDGVHMGTREGSTLLEAAWDTAQSANGLHSLTAVAEDDAGNRKEETIPVLVQNGDVRPPRVRMTAPLEGEAFGDRLSVRGTAEDESGIAKIEVYVNGSLKGTRTRSSFSMDLFTKSWRAGTYLVFLRAYDRAGNTAESPVRSVQKR
ncbi:MAG: S8 family serine peptidase [Fimbriimonadales bacterium]|nr:S8 family serine peptidase [Fimbriimonadales bacterium]